MTNPSEQGTYTPRMVLEKVDSCRLCTRHIAEELVCSGYAASEAVLQKETVVVDTFL